MKHAAVANRLSPLAAVPAAIFCAVLGAGCQSNNTGGQPDVIRPNAGGAPTTRATAAADNAANPTPAATGAGSVATIEGVGVPRGQLDALLYSAYGLDALMKLVQLDMAKAEATRAGVTVSPADVAAELKLTMKQLAPDQDESDYDALLKQLLNNQHISRPEFDVVMETNAYLRAIVRGQASANLTEPLIQEEFNLEYGERVRVRAIPVLNLQEAAAVREALAAPGARFEDVAKRMGRDPALAQLGGLLPEFTRTTTGISKVFIETAFSLQPGEVSTDTVQDSNSGLYYIIKAEDRLQPKAVKLDDVRDSVRAKLVARLTNNLMATLRQQFAVRAIRELQIADPTLRKQFEDRRAAANPKPAEKRDVQRSLEEQGTRASAGPSTVPGNAAGAGVTTRPTTSPAR